MRLAFAVAAHLEPEILLVDEVLAVGDINFQKKCLVKMGDVARPGRTIVLVSHNIAAVKALCSRAILIKKGPRQIWRRSRTSLMIICSATAPGINAKEWRDPAAAPGNENVRYAYTRITPPGNERHDYH